MGFRFHTGLLSAVAACALTIFFAFCVSWAFVLLGVVMRNPGSVQGMAFLTLFPLTFGTSMIAPKDTLPGWLQTWVEINPVAHVMDASRGLLNGGPVAGPVTWTLLASFAFLAVFAPLAVRAYRRRT
jgi:oleandomycin transport system permease protein